MTQSIGFCKLLGSSSSCCPCSDGVLERDFKTVTEEFVVDSRIWFGDRASEIEDITAMRIDTRGGIVGLQMNNWLWLVNCRRWIIEYRAGNDEWA